MSPPSSAPVEIDDSPPDETKSLPFHARGRGRLWHPMWIDLNRRSARRHGRDERLIRPATVALDRQIVPTADAAAYRVAVGANQYLIYRSLTPSSPRTVLGKHLRAGCYVGRFHAADGGLEDLLVVDEETESNPGALVDG